RRAALMGRKRAPLTWGELQAAANNDPGESVPRISTPSRGLRPFAPCSTRRKELDFTALFCRERALVEREGKPLPYVDQRFGQPIDHGIVVVGRRRDAQPLGSPRHRRIVD